MNIASLRKHPLTAAAAGGFLVFLIRAQLYRIGFDARGILSATHPLHLVCLGLSAAMAVHLAFSVRRDLPRAQPLVPFLTGLAGSYLLALHGLALTGQPNSFLNLLRCGLAMAAAIAMMICVFPIQKSSWVSGSCLGLVCIHYALDMLCRYRVWSGNPQLPDYCFHVLCAVALSLGTYQTLALHTGLPKPRLHRFFCLLALFLCPVCLIGPDGWEFYLSGAFWAAACLLIGVPAEEPSQEEPDVSA